MDRLIEHDQARAADGEPGGSQAVKALLRLREMVLAGELPAGTRIAELAIVEKLGVSRTPIRAALLRLEQEGLLEALPSGGYAVRSFSERDVADSIELRGTLEGLAARLAAERGVDDESFARYTRHNERFHNLLAEMVGSGTLARELDRVVRLPFASPSGFVVLQTDSPSARDMLVVAQDQHRQVLGAIDRREGARAEAIMREHSRLAQRNLRAAAADHLSEMPGVHLIRRRTGRSRP